MPLLQVLRTDEKFICRIFHIPSFLLYLWPFHYLQILLKLTLRVFFLWSNSLSRLPDWLTAPPLPPLRVLAADLLLQQYFQNPAGGPSYTLPQSHPRTCRLSLTRSPGFPYGSYPWRRLLTSEGRALCCLCTLCPAVAHDITVVRTSALQVRGRILLPESSW